MSYKIPERETLSFNELKRYKDIKIKDVLPFKNEDNIINEIQSLNKKEIFAKLLYYVKKRNKHIVFKILSDTEIDTNFSDSAGNSPLHYSVYYGLIDITAKLLYYGSLNNFINKYGETAIEAGRASIESNKDNKKYVKNNPNIEICISLIESSPGRINIDELKQDSNINDIRDNLNKICLENKEKIISIIISKAYKIIDDKQKISDVFDMIFMMAKDNELYLGIYVEVIISILNLDNSFNKKTGVLHILLRKTFEHYINAITDPMKVENQNIIKFITHFNIKKLLTNVFLQKIINDLFYVIEQSYDLETKIIEEQECIRLLIIVLTQIKPYQKKLFTTNGYEKKLSKYLDNSKYLLKPRLKFLIQDYLDL